LCNGRLTPCPEWDEGVAESGLDCAEGRGYISIWKVRNNVEEMVEEANVYWAKSSSYIRHVNCNCDCYRERDRMKKTVSDKTRLLMLKAIHSSTE
jgi:hypothetical protein